MIGWERWSTWNCAKNWNLIILQMIYAQTRIHFEEWDAQTSLKFWDINRTLGRRPDLVIVDKKMCRIMEIVVLADHRVKIKENEKRHKYLDLAREQKSYGTWRWQWCQLWLVRLERSLKAWWRDRKSWKSEEEPRASKLQRRWGQPEYWEESWKLKETCYHLTPVEDHQQTLV